MPKLQSLPLRNLSLLRLMWQRARQGYNPRDDAPAMWRPGTMTNRPANSDQKQNNRWRPGQSGNPAGKPQGTRNAVLRALDAIGEKGAQAALQAVVAAAGAGDLRAAEVLLSRVWPARRGRPVELPDLPALKSAADLPAALGTVARAVAAGEVTPEEAQAVAAVLEGQRRAIETAELEGRISALERNRETRR